MTTSVAGEPGADADRARAWAVAEVVRTSADAAGLALDDLAIWSLAGAVPPRPGVPRRRADTQGAAGAEAAARVGRALEGVTPREDRKALGLHVTPAWLADHLVALALPEVPGRDPCAAGDGPTVCDPACGGGAFLVAAARRLHALGIDRRRIVRDLLWGADIDPVGLAAAEAAVALWAGERPPPGRLVVADPLQEGAAAWPGRPAAGFATVVGNPPFQSQLGRATARDAADRARLRQRFGGAVRAYTDTAWLFLLLGCELVRPGGRVVLVQPQSVVAARDAAAVRDALHGRAVLERLWLDDGRVFSAAVRVCAPVLRREAGTEGNGGGGGGGGGAYGRFGTKRDGANGERRRPTDRPAADAWAESWAASVDLPAVDLGSGPVLGERARVVAGFRDQYYGLVDAVRERHPDESPDEVAPLVTSGALDWARCAWGDRTTRFAKRRWHAPVVDAGRLAGAPPAARRWVERTRQPKLVVATQTRVVEAAVDTGGRWVPSVPALAVLPDADSPVGVWHLAAAVLSPAATAWLARRSAGTGLERGALKVAAPDLAALPLPEEGEAWDAAAAALATFAAGPTAPGAGALLDRYLGAVAAAYGTAAPLDRWWRRRAGTVVQAGPPEG